MRGAKMCDEPTRQLALADAVVGVIKATLTPMVAPLVDELAACHRLIERLTTEIAELREDRGRSRQSWKPGPTRWSGPRRSSTPRGPRTRTERHVVRPDRTTYPDHASGGITLRAMKARQIP